MNQTKTAVIIGIVCVILLGALLYANRDGFTSKSTKKEEAKAEVLEDAEAAE